MRRATVYRVGREEEVGERQVEAGGERGRARHLPLPYLLLPHPPSPAPASLGPATVLYGTDF
ncbi:hypothetical protein PPACK8108_LOCUS15411 [Phakopsora pachyrhizi]|uniref:Uncharacterized protein n=1 Tax=Phakopsora pachyrhizi TaxID=170000 RepID=A0AAV0B9A0_PHAPC|nr:hypothetical protein PPACK8108_LOCUS15411 [Phakopsora pachyrhizi]